MKWGGFDKRDCGWLQSHAAGFHLGSSQHVFRIILATENDSENIFLKYKFAEHDSLLWESNLNALFIEKGYLPSQVNNFKMKTSGYEVIVDSAQMKSIYFVPKWLKALTGLSHTGFIPILCSWSHMQPKIDFSIRH